MEVDHECIFCQQSDVGVYEMNANSVLIDGDLVEFYDLIYDLFYLRVSLFWFEMNFFYSLNSLISAET